jgi:predicted nuclease of restriction endonuclease-like (RecB) superfamily
MAQVKATFSVNRELIILYWQIGKMVASVQKTPGWGKATTNFDRTLPPIHSDMAQQSLKDPYIFDFLTIAAEFRERELECELIKHLQEFLIELGVGFAFVCRQYHIVVGNSDFRIRIRL